MSETLELEPEVNLQGMSSTHHRTATSFIEQVIDLASKGYVLHPKPVSLRQAPSFVGRPRCTMVTKERAIEILGGKVKEDVVPKPAVIVEEAPVAKDTVVTKADALKTLTTKAEMLDFAKEEGLEVPEDNIAKGTASIKKSLLSKLAE